jgi:ferric-dicitrate binding protein FerR (iron transport regulator)
MLRSLPRAGIAAAAVFTLVGLVLLSGDAAAQSQAGCKPDPSAGAGPAITLDCGFGLKITVERSARYAVVDGDKDGRADGLNLSRGGALVSLAPGGGRGFQILTPRAVASVRGTEWAVDAGADVTSVLVLSGAVAVTPRGGGSGVVLRAGEGADVRGPGDVTAIRWGRARVAALLARFGR